MELGLIYGSTSIVDINDIIPESIKALNGKIISFGLPTDPGNLLLFGELNNIKIIGVPGCAKSLTRNGFDLVLEKVCFGFKVDKKVIAEMSNGGLFKTQIKK
jgi:molybdenum cofactor cytidylyltransferase